MTVYEERRDELERHEFMMGKARGRLAVTLDVLTDALVLVGQHGAVRDVLRRDPVVGRPAARVRGARGGRAPSGSTRDTKHATG